MSDLTTIASGLRFPEGPVAMPDGSVILVEIAAGRGPLPAPEPRLRRPEKTKVRPAQARAATIDKIPSPSRRILRVSMNETTFADSFAPQTLRL